MLSVPSRHSPEAKENIFLLKRDIVKAAINWVFLVRLGVFIASNYLELGSLSEISVHICREFGKRTRADKSVIHINMPLSLACSHSILP